MSDTLPSARIESGTPPVPPSDPVVTPSTVAPTSVVPVSAAPAPLRTDDPPSTRDRYEQLARLEDKTSRIEEKYARSEAMMQRVADKVEIATARMGEVALQSDLSAVRGEIAVIGRRLKGLPGMTGFVVTAVVAAVLTAVLMVAIMRFAPGVIGR